jgi:hypothetical protein
VKLTYEDLLQLPDDGLRHELIDGEHYVTALGRILYAPFDIKLSDRDVVEPDLMYLSHARGDAILTPERAIGALGNW